MKHLLSHLLAVQTKALGAAMVAVGTVLFHDPSACSRIQRELEEELVARGIDRVSEVVGRAHDGAGAVADRHSWALAGAGAVAGGGSILRATKGG